MYSMKSMFWTNKKHLSWLRGRHQFGFPASKLRVLLAIWFGFLIVETQWFQERTSGVLALEYFNTMHSYSYLLAVGSDALGFEATTFKIIDRNHFHS